jgi:hypothetical protein
LHIDEHIAGVVMALAHPTGGERQGLDVGLFAGNGGQILAEELLDLGRVLYSSLAGPSCARSGESCGGTEMPIMRAA